jgi:integrase
MSKHPGIFVRKNKNGVRYQVKWRLADGKQVSKTFRTMSEARAFKHRLEVDKSRGLLPDLSRGNMPFAEYARDVFASLEHAPTTIRRRDGIMNKYILPQLGKMPINRITRECIQREVNSWRSNDLAPRSIINHLNILRPIFKQALIDDIIFKDPLKGLQTPKPRDVIRNPLSASECKALLAAINPAYQFAIHVGLATGLRWDEFATVQIKDFRPTENLLRVCRSKTDAGVRELKLDPEDTLIISQHIVATGRVGAEADSPLFTTPGGRALNYSNFRKKVFKPACERAGLPTITFHDLRRTHATMLVSQGLDPKVVQYRMGHKSIITTLKYYAVATEKMKLHAAGAKKRYLEEGFSSGRDAAAQETRAGTPAGNRWVREVSILPLAR